MYPKLVALDTDWTLFWGWLDPKQSNWGKGPGAYSPAEDNIEKVDYWDIRDRSIKCGLYADVPRIIKDIQKNGAKIAIVSRNSSKGLCDRALWYWKVNDASGKERSIIDLVKFDEVYDRPKTEHFAKIKGWTKYEYHDMILFDDEAINNTVEMMLGMFWSLLIVALRAHRLQGSRSRSRVIKRA
ncbi:hypothetical protein PAXRUDRAFT_407884 [Paxillus rubicundulus Ve08.2h10]|uniref:Magnesium-dependent phosphatase-1 n=1 Tax=Paxillus rubicundulus Ve08.2h10 TaxID=930991 RepID=A0A0D0E8N8_9AGAM|nr:hypothetical protein PAXRUDRAFT_407884 [Paxillus rubicundulus Ve08.2h10]